MSTKRQACSKLFAFLLLAFTGVGTASASLGGEISRSSLVATSTKGPLGDGIEKTVARLDARPAPTFVRGGQEVSKPPLQMSTKFAVLSGMLLAFNSGYVNGACLSGILASDGTKQASAAVTGAWTNSALGWASGNTAQFLFNAKCILSYMSGSGIASLLNPNPTAFVLSKGGVSPAFLLGSVLLYASSAIAGKKDGSDNKLFIYLAAIANGMQNSITSTATANLVRSAHFSGITSDIGTFLGQVLRGNNQNLMKLKVFSALAASFWVGGAVSYYVTKEFASTSLLFSAVLYLAIGLCVALL